MNPRSLEAGGHRAAANRVAANGAADWRVAPDGAASLGIAAGRVAACCVAVLCAAALSTSPALGQPDQPPGQPPDAVQDQAPFQALDHDPCQALDQAPFQALDHAPCQALDHAPDQPLDHDPCQALDHAPDQAPTPTSTPDPDQEFRAWLPVAYRGHWQVHILERSPMPDLGGCARERFTPRGGQFRINDVAVDGRGTLWFATDVGAIGVGGDGSWTHLTNDRDGLAYDWVNTVGIDVHGFPWFGAELDHRYPDGEVFLVGGVSAYFDPNLVTWRNTGDVGPGGFGRVRDIAVDRANRKWVIMGRREVIGYVHWGGVYQLSDDNLTWQYFDNEAGVDLSRADRATVDDRGVVWFETRSGLVRHEPDGTWTRDLGQGAPDPSAADLVAMPPDGSEVWTVSWPGEMNDYTTYLLHQRDRSGQWFVVGPPPDVGAHYPHDIAVDGAGNFWWVSETGSGVRWSTGEWLTYDDGGIADASYIAQATVDATGAVWFDAGSDWVRVQCPVARP